MKMQTFIETAKINCSYNAAQKQKFHRQGRAALKMLADHLGLRAGEYDIRSNQGGIAVSGEITLHSETLYVQLAQSCLGHNAGSMWRACDGRKDYCGKVNRWAAWEHLNDLPGLCSQIHRELAIYARQAVATK